MRNFVPLAALAIALSFAPAQSPGYGLRQLLFGPSDGCGCGLGCEPTCACGPGCAVEPCCAFEPGCAVEPCCAFEPSCGCVAPCGIDGRQFAGMKWDHCHELGAPTKGCIGPCGPGGHCCEPTCGCVEPTCGCFEPACGCFEPSCGCVEPTCGCGPSGCGPARRGGAGRWLRAVVSKICPPFGKGGCSGCSSELYWCEWYNDPPLCCDPCDCHGNWIGPSYGGYRAPYDHPHMPPGHLPMPPGHPHMPPAEYYEPGGPEVEVEARAPWSQGAVTRTGAPAVRPPSARKPYPPAHQTYRR